MGNLEEATRRSVALIEAALKQITTVPMDCACRKALDLAVWTRPDAIADSVKQKMSPVLQRRLNLA